MGDIEYIINQIITADSSMQNIEELLSDHDFTRLNSFENLNTISENLSSYYNNDNNPESKLKLIYFSAFYLNIIGKINAPTYAKSELKTSCINNTLNYIEDLYDTIPEEDFHIHIDETEHIKGKSYFEKAKLAHYDKLGLLKKAQWSFISSSLTKPEEMSEVCFQLGNVDTKNQDRHYNESILELEAGMNQFPSIYKYYLEKAILLKDKDIKCEKLKNKINNIMTYMVSISFNLN